MDNDEKIQKLFDGMTPEIIEDFAASIPSLLADEIEFNKKRGLLNSRLAKVRSLGNEDLSKEEIETAKRMIRNNQAGIGLDGRLFGFCLCLTCGEGGKPCGRNWREEDWPEAYDTGVTVLYKKEEEDNES